MASKINYEETAAQLVELAGGKENIKTVAHCATRLRFTLVDEKKADIEKIKKVPGVLGCIYQTQQLQTILGQEVLRVYEATLKNYSFTDAGSVDATKDEKDPLTFRNAFDRIIGFVSGAVAPLVPALIAGGMLKVFLLLITYISPSFSSSSTYTILGWVANAPFYFMPIFVAYGAATKLGGTPIYAMAAVASQLTPAFMSAVSEGTQLTLVGLPVRLVKYQQQLLPALLITLACYHIEKLLNKVVPGIFKSIFVGAGTMALSMILGFTILGPIGSYIGSAISGVFVWLGANVGFLAVGILSAALPWLVMTGMHHAISPFMAQSIANPGYDPIFRPSFILHNMAEGGACLGVGLKTKDPEFRSECLSLAFGCIVAGVTEPTIYGVNLKLKKPMIGVMAGGAVGGIVTGLLGAKAYSMGYSTIMALPIFEDTILAMLVGIIVAIVVAAAVTFVLGFNESDR
ncbi:MAG: PTS transporter subunit EIIC [Erysipelotrichaceae bacterium]|nr:PTS transporter subunit EIIC [Erysipelotrichaceae bacterium]